MNSIQRRLIRTLILIVPTLAAMSGVIIYVYCRSRLIAQFDRALLTQARSIANSLMREGNGGLEFYFVEADHPEFRRKEHPDYFEIWRGDGSVFRKSQSLGATDLPKLTPGNPAPVVSAIMHANGAPIRATTFQVVPHLDLDDVPRPRGSPPVANEPLLLVVASNPHSLFETLSTIASALAIAGVVLAVSIVGAVIVAVRRGLAPLRDLALQADAIDAESLHQRLSQDALPLELSPLAQKLNELLARLEGAFRRERSFASAAAHELRTPIAELRSLAEVSLRWPEESNSQQNVKDTLKIAQRMESLVKALMTIVRSDGRPQTVRLVAVDLDALVQELWRHYQLRAEQRKLTFSFASTEQPVVITDALMIRAVLDNLISNAVSHTPIGGDIEIRLKHCAGQLQVVIENGCEGLAADDLPRLFEPFWRKDDSRTGGEHFGLGLSLVASYATALGIPVQAKLQSPQRFSIMVGPMPLTKTAPVPRAEFTG